MWVPAVLAIIQILPSVVHMVGVLTKQVEPESPIGGGAVQKQAVVGLVRAGVEAADKLAPDGELMSTQEKQAVVEIADKAVDLMVGLYNTTGTFSKAHRKSPEVSVEVQTSVSAAA